jgi:superfamily I DNA/RNA helicase
VPTPPKITSLAERFANGTAPPIPVKDSIALLTAPHRPRDPEALLLALQVPARGAGDHLRVQAGRVLRGRPVGLGDVRDDHAAEEHDHHRRVDRVALPAVSGHPPVHEHQ